MIQESMVSFQLTLLAWQLQPNNDNCYRSEVVAKVGFRIDMEYLGSFAFSEVDEDVSDSIQHDIEAYGGI